MKAFITLVGFLFLTSFSLQAQENWDFTFGKKTTNKKTSTIQNTLSYSNEIGYGFDIENQQAVEIVSAKKIGFCTADVPFYFSTKVPEGNYDVEITFGNPKAASTTTIKAEARRLMVYNQALKKGKSKTVYITVNVRTPKIDENQSIRLKSREVNYLNWDNRLSLEFSGENVAIQSIKIQKKQNFTTVFLAGNSTVTDQDCAPWASWGQMITPYFDQEIVVANYAESGEALASFKSARRLDKILYLMEEGDYLFIEFGHNDQKRKGEGIGPWDSFTDLLHEFITRAREKGGIPVLVTPTQRRSFNDEGVIQHTHLDYPDAMRKVAKDLDVPLIDVHAMTKVMYETWGIEASKKAFVHYPANTFPGQEKKLQDNTHFNTFGAHEVAQCILQGISEFDLDLKNHIINFDSYSPLKPNSFEEWKLPMSPRFISKKPEGN